MGQYFIIVNLDKKEYVEPTLLKLWEICVNDDIKVLAWLLATNNPDGTGILKSYYTGDVEEAKKKCEEETKRECEPFYIDDRGRFIIMQPKLKYFGRWCGDRIALVGDYADLATNYNGPSFGLILHTYKDITKEVVEEYNMFVGKEHEIKTTYIMPDIVITSNKIYHNPKINISR